MPVSALEFRQDARSGTGCRFSEDRASDGTILRTVRMNVAGSTDHAPALGHAMKRAIVLALIAASLGGSRARTGAIGGTRSHQTCRCGGRRRAGAARPQIGEDHGRSEVVGAGPVGGDRRPGLFAGDTKFTTVWDLANGNARTVDRSYIAVGRAMCNSTRLLTPKYGFVTDEKSSRPMSGIRVAAQLRELNRIAPNLLIRMLDNPGSTTFRGRRADRGRRAARRDISRTARRRSPSSSARRRSCRQSCAPRTTMQCAARPISKCGSTTGSR